MRARDRVEVSKFPPFFRGQTRVKKESCPLHRLNCPLHTPENLCNGQIRSMQWTDKSMQWTTHFFFVFFAAVRAGFPRHLSKFEQLRGFTRMSPLESPCGGALHVIGAFPGFKRCAAVYTAWLRGERVRATLFWAFYVLVSVFEAHRCSMRGYFP